MTVDEMFLMAEDSQKLFITVNDERYSGYWYEDKMLKINLDYFHRPVDITFESPERIVARVRRY